jgi:tetratricopeptide (TPR) repeat protein
MLIHVTLTHALGCQSPTQDPETVAEKVEAALKRKEKGNAHVKEKKYANALTQYEAGLEFFKSQWGMSDEEKASANQVCLPLHLNAAFCQIQMGDFRAALVNCEKALDIDENHTKVRCVCVCVCVFLGKK